MCNVSVYGGNYKFSHNGRRMVDEWLLWSFSFDLVYVKLDQKSKKRSCVIFIEEKKHYIEGFLVAIVYTNEKPWEIL